MTFANPEAFVFLLCVPVLLGFFLWNAAWKRRRGAAFVAESLQDRLTPSVSRARVRWKRGLVLIGLVLVVVAAARPQFGTRVRYVEQRGIDVVVALDTSESMSADDFKPDRFSAARLAIRRIVRKLTGDRVALVCFSGDAFIQSPLTADYDGFMVLMDAVEIGDIPRPGTNLQAAVDKALLALERGGGGKKGVIVLFTDGESHEGDLDAVIARASERDCVIYTIGYGTEGGAPIGGRGAYKKDREGNVIITRLDAATLDKLADGTGGRYFPATQGGGEIDELFEEIEKFEKGEALTERVEARADRYQICLVAGFLCLAIEAALGVRRRDA